MMPIRKPIRGTYGGIVLRVVALRWPTAAGQVPDSIPHLVRIGNRSELIVDGKPFLILGGRADELELVECGIHAPGMASHCCVPHEYRC